MRHLDEINTAYFVAKLGTVSAAAAQLGVHRATVTRRIDALEINLGGKLFLRHKRGYCVTDLGREVMFSGERIEDEVRRLIGCSTADSSVVAAEFKIASTSASYSPELILSVKAFRKKHKNVVVKHISVEEPPRLEFGDAHIYFHFGKKLEHPDYVHVPWKSCSGGVYGSERYFSKHGNPITVQEFKRHNFAILAHDGCSPHDEWLRDQVPSENIVLESNDRLAIWHAIMDGLAIGFLPDHLAVSNPGVERILVPMPELETQRWTITHVDYHRTARVQAFFKCMRDIGLMRRSATDFG